MPNRRIASILTILVVLLGALSTGVLSAYASSNRDGKVSAYTLTPAGEAPVACVHGVGNDAQIFSNDTVRFANGTRISYSPCPHSVQYPCTQSCWITWAWYEYSSGILNFDGNWAVPGNPGTPNDGQLIYLWIGMECCNSGASGGNNGILQPVLQWGSNGAFGGSYWVIASWYIDQNGNAYYSSPVRVYSGNGLSGGVDWVYNPIINEYGWQVSLSGGSSNSNLYVGTLSGQYNTMTDAYVNLEAFGVYKCSDYPSSGSTTFSSLYMGPITPSWVGDSAPWNKIGCGESTTINSASSVTISY